MLRTVAAIALVCTAAAHGARVENLADRVPRSADDAAAMAAEALLQPLTADGAGGIAVSVPARPVRDPTLIEVPSNTLGPGEPLWVRRDRERAAARIDEARADLAEREAAAYDRDLDRHPGFVIYGPHGPRTYRGGRPGPFRVVERPTDDVFDAAQIQFGRVATPRIGPAIEGQQDAQRRFGRIAAPPIVDTQNNLDKGQLRTRKANP
jgi:hypothetical protein